MKIQLLLFVACVAGAWVAAKAIYPPFAPPSVPRCVANTTESCVKDCGCGYCPEVGCFFWPNKRHKSHAYRVVKEKCKGTPSSTEYYSDHCVMTRRIAAVVTAVGGLLLACCLVAVIGSLCFLCAVYLSEEEQDYL